MAELKISKIQMRRGPQEDMPGAPASLTPTTMSPGLSEGELGFTTDTGKLFIGHIPTEGQSNYLRTSFPYQNLEILTENSYPTLRRMVGNINKQGRSESYIPSTVVGDRKWHNVLYGNPLQPFSFGIESFTAEISYSVSTVEGVAKRIGTVRIIHLGGNSAPVLKDDAHFVPDLDDFTFRLSKLNGDVPSLLLQCRNTSTIDNRLLFKITYLPVS